MSKYLITLIIIILSITASKRKITESIKFSFFHQNSEYNLLKDTITKLAPNILETKIITKGNYKLAEKIDDSSNKKKYYKFEISGNPNCKFMLYFQDNEKIEENEALKKQLKKCGSKNKELKKYKFIKEVFFDKKNKEDFLYFNLIESINKIIPNFMDDKEIIQGRYTESKKKKKNIENFFFTLNFRINGNSFCDFYVQFFDFEKYEESSEFQKQVFDCVRDQGGEIIEDKVKGDLIGDTVLEDSVFEDVGEDPVLESVGKDLGESGEEDLIIV